MLKVFKRYVFRCNIEKSSIEGPDEKSARAGTRGRQPPLFIGTSRRILTDTHSKHSKERTPNITPKLQARSELQAACKRTASKLQYVGTYRPSTH